MAELDDIRRRLKAAKFSDLVVRLTYKHRWLIDQQGCFDIRIGKLDECKPEQADMLAHAPTDIQFLLDRIERLENLSALQETIVQLHAGASHTDLTLEEITESFKQMLRFAHESREIKAVVEVPSE